MERKYDLIIFGYGGVYSFEYNAKNYDYIMKTAFGKVPNKAEQQLISVQSHLLGSNQIDTEKANTCYAWGSK